MIHQINRISAEINNIKGSLHINIKTPKTVNQICFISTYKEIFKHRQNMIRMHENSRKGDKLK